VGKRDRLRLSESLRSSEVSSVQQGVLTEKNDNSILIIRGIEILLPRIQFEAKTCVESAEEEGHPMQTIMEEDMV
jgi:hypothetical protein